MTREREREREERKMIEGGVKSGGIKRQIIKRWSERNQTTSVEKKKKTIEGEVNQMGERERKKESKKKKWKETREMWLPLLAWVVVTSLSSDFSCQCKKTQPHLYHRKVLKLIEGGFWNLQERQNERTKRIRDEYCCLYI